MKQDKKRNYTWVYGSINEILIYEQEQEDENTYNCISQIVDQLKQENQNFIFNLKNCKNICKYCNEETKEGQKFCSNFCKGEYYGINIYSGDNLPFN